MTPDTAVTLTPEQARGDLAAFMLRHRPEGDWPSAKLPPGAATEEVVQSVHADLWYAYAWANQMLGIRPGQETHELFLKAVARAVLALAREEQSR